MTSCLFTWTIKFYQNWVCSLNKGPSSFLEELIALKIELEGKMKIAEMLLLTVYSFT